MIGKPDAELAKLLGKVAWELSGTADIEKCIKDPSLGGCVMAAAGVLPVGKIKIAGKIYDGIESVAKASKYAKLPPCVKHSFPAGTRVLMGDRTTRPIEQLRIGDQVLATDPETGATGPRRVDATIYTPDDRQFTDITLAPNSGGASLTTTDHHPFWAEGDKTWKNAGDLTPQDTLRTPDGGAAQIGAVRQWTGLQPAYNLTVNDLHTYYVMAGTTAVLVHNTPCDVVIDNGKWDYFFGHVDSSPHNAARSTQNAYQLEGIGIRDNELGRQVLTEFFDEAKRSNVIETYVNPKNNLTNLRTESVLYGPRGALLVRANYEVTEGGIRLTTMIPVGGRGYGK